MKNLFGVHKIWFSYDDERSGDATFEGGLPECYKTFNTKEEAQNEVNRLHVKAYRNIGLKDLGNYHIDSNINSPSDDALGNLLFEAGWDENIVLHEIDYSFRELSEEKILSLVKIARVVFYKIIEHESSEIIFFVKWSEIFWSKNVIQFLIASNCVISHGDWLSFEPNQKLAKKFGYQHYGYPFYKNGKPIKGIFSIKYPRKIAHFDTLEEAWFFAIKLFIKLMKQFSKEELYFSKLNDFEFENIASVYGFSFLDFEKIELRNLELKDINKIKGYIQLLKEPPFEIIERYKSINGKYIQDNLFGIV